MAPEVMVFLSAMTPVGELRLSIPLGLAVYRLPWPQVVLLSLVGNMLPPLFLLWALEGVSRALLRCPRPVGPLFRRYLHLVTVRYGPLLRRYGPLALVPVVAVPLPGTGAWTGALLAWALHLPRVRALGAIGLGVLVAGAVVTALTLTGRALAVDR